MPSYFEIYFGDHGAAENTLRKLTQVAGVQFESIDEPYADYRAILDAGTDHFITFEFATQVKMDSEADEDTGIPFKEMSRKITIRGTRKNREQQKQITQSVFEQLKGGKYKPIYFVYDLDEVIDSWDPDEKGNSEVMEFWEPDQKGDPDVGS
ncbi:hypothetical protein [Saccharopolyspora shandongensis]|uniref:hypothetical protein n=1 Tax=Saccharopolyspora shandongensis TaxID=418495 RepID=UPI0033F6E7C9